MTSTSWNIFWHVSELCSVWISGVSNEFLQNVVVFFFFFLYCDIVGGLLFNSFVIGQKQPKTIYQTVAEGAETVCSGWIFLPLFCFLVNLWNQHLLPRTFVENF